MRHPSNIIPKTPYIIGVSKTATIDNRWFSSFTVITAGVVTLEGAGFYKYYDATAGDGTAAAKIADIFGKLGASENLGGYITQNPTEATNGTYTVATSTDGNGKDATLLLNVSTNTVTIVFVSGQGESTPNLLKGYRVGDTLSVDKALIGAEKDLIITLAAESLYVVAGFYEMKSDARVDVTLSAGQTLLGRFNKIKTDAASTAIGYIGGNR